MLRYEMCSDPDLWAVLSQAFQLLISYSQAEQRKQCSLHLTANSQ